MELFKDWSNVALFRRATDYPCCSILDFLEFVEKMITEARVETVAVVQSTENEGSNKRVGSVSGDERTDTADGS